MPKFLTEQQVEQYQSDGYLCPLDLLSAEEIAYYRGVIEAHERQHGGPLKGPLRHKTHLLFTALNDLVRHPRLLDAVEDILGPNLLCWSTSFFIKEARDPAFVSWHQDATYWGLSSPDVTTAWIALSDSNRESGCMHVIPGSHRRQLPHVDTFQENNLLTRGQEIAVKVDEAEAVEIILKPGQFSLHHVLLAHGSDPNRSNDRRIGFAIRYIPTHVRQIAGPKDSATLVRGEDRYGHFELEPRPDRDFAPESVALHDEITRRQAAILYAGTERKEFRD